jgi:hypothetical protein
MRKKEIKNIVDRMRFFFMYHPDSHNHPDGPRQFASRELVEKWADEIEACLRENK